MDFKYDRAFYGVNCLDKEKGLPYLLTLVRKGCIPKFDLCLTDPFYNIGAGVCKGGKFKFRREGIVETYDDLMLPELYKIFSNIWFYYVKKLCKMVVFTCGKTNLQMWYNIADFKEGIWLIRNSSSRGYISKFVKFEPILFYGDFKKNKLLFDVLDCYVNSGFLTKKHQNLEKNIKHPHPKPRLLYYKILSQLKPKTVIDPFLGSGTVAEIATKLGIQWIGYELKTEYEQDLINRLETTTKELTQLSLSKFF